MKRSYRNILNDVARQHIPTNTDLFPKIAAQLERNILMKTFHASPAISIIILVVALSLLTGVVYAVGHALGYIPGIGFVNQDTLVRTLIQPATSERDGIKLTVTDAVLTSEKTVVLYTLDNVPWDIMSRQENEPGCYDLPLLRLPDGSMLASNEAGGFSSQMRVVYPAIPAGVDDVTFILPCIMNSLPGLGPENWELRIGFGSTSPEMTIVPVIQITPNPVVESMNETAPFVLDNSLLVGDQYILTGTTKQPEADGYIELINIQVTDAEGTQVNTQMPALTDLPSFDWGLQFQAEAVEFPITLAFEWKKIEPIVGSTAVFKFDVGENPQPGQEWAVNQPIQIGGRTITLETIRADSRGGYNFSFSGDPDVSGLSLQIPGAAVLGGGGGGDGQGKFSVSQSYTELPKSKLKVILSNLLVSTPPETWSMQWSFENPPEFEANELASSSEACLTVTKWNQLTEQNEMQFPTVEGKIITTVNEGGLLPAIYISNPDGSNSRYAATGGWPSLSNAGDRLAYSAGDGLHVFDLSTEENITFGYDGYGIIWSPDDTRLLFTTTFNLYLVNSDGTNLEKINTDPSQVLATVGWLPDNQGIIYSKLTGAGFELIKYNLDSGETETLFTINNKAGYGALSPDGKWLVFADRVSEAANWSIFTSHVDGSERRLIAEPEVPTAFMSVWSPDGSWVVINTHSSDGSQIPVLVNLFTCQSAVMSLSGPVHGWSR